MRHVSGDVVQPHLYVCGLHKDWMAKERKPGRKKEAKEGKPDIHRKEIALPICTAMLICC